MATPYEDEFLSECSEDDVSNSTESSDSPPQQKIKKLCGKLGKKRKKKSKFKWNKKKKVKKDSSDSYSKSYNQPKTKKRMEYCKSQDTTYQDEKPMSGLSPENLLLGK